jgi:flagellar export protein FliJ
MKLRKFTLGNILKYREHLEKEQITRFRDALRTERIVEKDLTERRDDLSRLRSKRDNLVSAKKIDILKIKSLQEEILFSELDEDVLEKNLFNAQDSTEKERKAWVSKKSEKDAIVKLKEKHAKSVEKENLKEEQKEIDEVAGRKFQEKK